MAGSTKSRNGWRQSPWRKAVYGSAALLLLLPLVAMQFTREVVWSPLDFAVFGVMLLVACGTYDLAARAVGHSAYRAAVGIAIAGAFLLVWMNLAVGIIGNEADPANLMFGGVLAVGITGALRSRFRSDGMARALVATALAQASVALIALLSGSGDKRVLLSLTGLFVSLWLASAGLFRRAGRDQVGAAP